MRPSATAGSTAGVDVAEYRITGFDVNDGCLSSWLKCPILTERASMSSARAAD
jgi:hypothetical protein